MSDDERRSGRADYEVGYGKPPKKGRFRPGQSGNPKGHASRPPKVADLLAREAKRVVTVTIDGEKQKLSQLEVVIRTLVRKAMAGDLNAVKQVIQAFREIPETAEVDEMISDHELQLLMEVLEARRRSSDPDEVQF